MSTVAIIFSMDRALQCDALVRSLRDHASNLDEMVVIWKASSELHRRAYEQMAIESSAIFVRQIDQPLGQLVYESVQGHTHVCLNVDDQIYFRSTDFAHATRWGFVYSWRLGHMPGVTQSLKGRAWSCKAARDLHYGYVWHTDGAVYRVQNYISVLDQWVPHWRTNPALIPNDLEQGPAASREKWSAEAGHFGPLEATCMTWQINKEKTTKGRYGAPWFEIPGLTDLDTLAYKFIEGKRVVNEILYADQSWTRRFQQPGSSPTHVRACAEASQFFASCIR